MFAQTILPVLPSAISSRVSGSGVTPYAVPAGPMTALSGREVAPVNLSPRQAAERGCLTSGTYGPRSSILLASAALSQSLANRLRQRTGWAGSTLFSLTWKEQVTPAGRVIPLLRASVRRISDSGFTGWPTPCSQDGPKGGPAQGTDRLPGAVQLAGWPTPRAAEAGPDFAIMNREKSGGVSLQTAAQLTGWVTPSARDWKDTPGMSTERPDGRKRLDQLPRQATLAGWKTPAATDDKRGGRITTGMTGGQSGAAGEIYRPGPADGFWRNADWLLCQDGKWRPVEPGSSPLAHGATARVGRLRGYGNAIVAPQATAFIKAFMET